MHGSCLKRWKRKHLCEMDAAVPAGSRSASELAAENERLRRELAYMTEQRDIPKKRYASSARSKAESAGDGVSMPRSSCVVGLRSPWAVAIGTLRSIIEEAFQAKPRGSVPRLGYREDMPRAQMRLRISQDAAGPEVRGAFP